VTHEFHLSRAWSIVIGVAACTFPAHQRAVALHLDRHERAHRLRIVDVSLSRLGSSTSPVRGRATLWPLSRAFRGATVSSAGAAAPAELTPPALPATVP